MKHFLHLLGHILIGVLQFAAQCSDLVPGEYKPVAVAVGSAAQAVLALYNRRAVSTPSSPSVSTR